jgi:hypothetical protein
MPVSEGEIANPSQLQNSSQDATMWWLTPVPEDSHSLPHSIEYSGIRPVMNKARGFSPNNNTSNQILK